MAPARRAAGRPARPNAQVTSQAVSPLGARQWPKLAQRHEPLGLKRRLHRLRLKTRPEPFESLEVLPHGQGAEANFPSPGNRVRDIVAGGARHSEAAREAPTGAGSPSQQDAVRWRWGLPRRAPEDLGLPCRACSKAARAASLRGAGGSDVVRGPRLLLGGGLRALGGV